MTPNQFIEKFQEYILKNQINPNECTVKVANSLYWYDVDNFEYDEENQIIVVNGKDE